MFDRWSNIKHNPLINILEVNSRGAMFMYADDFSRIEKTCKIISGYLLKAIEDIGLSNSLQIVIDNAKNCQVAGKEIEKVHKHIFLSPRVCEICQCIFKDLANAFSWLNETFRKGKSIVKSTLTLNLLICWLQSIEHLKATSLSIL